MIRSQVSGKRYPQRVEINLFFLGGASFTIVFFEVYAEVKFFSVEKNEQISGSHRMFTTEAKSLYQAK